MTKEEIALSNAYQRNVRKKLPTTAEQKRAWSLRVAELEVAKRNRDPVAYERAIKAKRARSVRTGAKAAGEARAHRRRRAVIDAIKVHAGCAGCKRKDLPPECLDFDHLPGAEKRWSIGVNMRRDMNAILDEIAKCEIVCANCHRTRTVGRKRAKGLREVAPARYQTIDHKKNRIDFYQLAVERGLLPQEH